MVEQSELLEEIKRLREECSHLRKERDSYRKTLNESTADSESILNVKLENHCDKLSKQIWEDYEKRTRRGIILISSIIAILGFTGFFSIRNMIESQVQQSIEEKVGSAIKEKSDQINRLSVQALESLLQSLQKIESQLAIFKVNLDIIGRDALIYGIHGGDPEVVRMILNLGADANAEDGDQTPALIIATKRNHLDIVETLLDGNAKVDQKDKFGNTALMYAAREDFFNIAEVLIAAGADVNARSYFTGDDGATPLIIATKQKSVRTVELLLSKGADAAATDEKGLTALTWAQDRKFDQIVRLFKKPH